MFKYTLAFLTILLLFVCGAHAYSFPMPALNGPSGLVRIPDASVIPYKNWNIGVDYGSRFSSSTTTEGTPTMFYKANLGSFHNFELGLVGGLDNAGREMREGVFINMKYSPTLGDGSDPLLLAIGVENLASKTQTGLYMVATKPFSQGPKLSFGFLADFPANKFRPMGIAGLDFPVGNTLSLMADLFAGETVFQLNAGARYFLLPTFAVDARGINLLGPSDSQVAKDSKQYLLGISWANPF